MRPRWGVRWDFEHGISTLVPPAQKKARETLKFWRFFWGKLVGTHETEVGLAIYVLHRILLLVDPTRGTYFHQSLAPVFEDLPSCATSCGLHKPRPCMCLTTSLRRALALEALEKLQPTHACSRLHGAHKRPQSPGPSSSPVIFDHNSRGSL